MSGDFFDSNVLIYLFDNAEPRKKEQSERVVRSALQDENAYISFQVVQEVLNGVTRKIERPARPETARELFDEVLFPMWRVMPSRELYEQALRIHGRYQFPFYDSLIVAAALEADCDRLLTEDFQHGQTIESLRIENPFLGL